MNIILRDHEHDASLIVRVLKPQPVVPFSMVADVIEDEPALVVMDGFVTEAGPVRRIPLPYAPGDVLIGKETWAPTLPGKVMYRSDVVWLPLEPGFRWRSPVTMPAWASRWRRVVTDVAVKRVQEITEEEAGASGIETPHCPACGYSFQDCVIQGDHSLCPELTPAKAVAAFEAAWNATNPAHPWSDNPWIVAVSVKEQAI